MVGRLDEARETKPQRSEVDRTTRGPLSKQERAERMRRHEEERSRRARALLAALKTRADEIERLLADFRDCEEDGVYRYYHQSLKVFALQGLLRRARELFEELAPADEPLLLGFSREVDDTVLCHSFLEIYDSAVAHEFLTARSNQNWLAETRPILEAFWHCGYFLEQMLCSANELEEPPQSMPSGWAAILSLYRLR